MDILYFFFFFQAEDGIRDIGVTGVQTYALPIYDRAYPRNCRGCAPFARCAYGRGVRAPVLSTPSHGGGRGRPPPAARSRPPTRWPLPGRPLLGVRVASPPLRVRLPGGSRCAHVPHP